MTFVSTDDNPVWEQRSSLNRTHLRSDAKHLWALIYTLHTHTHNMHLEGLLLQVCVCVCWSQSHIDGCSIRWYPCVRPSFTNPPGGKTILSIQVRPLPRESQSSGYITALCVRLYVSVFLRSTRTSTGPIKDTTGDIYGEARCNAC